MTHLLQPSPLWQLHRKLPTVRFAAAVLIVIICFTLVGLVSPSLVGLQVHQRYLYLSRLSELDDATLGQEIRWIANGRGARGDLYHGQPNQIAIFGSSTSEDWALDQNQTWAQQLKLQLGEDSYHVDNFARNDSYHKEALVILKELARQGRSYDAVLLMVQIDRSERSESLADAFFYWSQWASGYSGITGSWTLLVDRIKAQVKSEDRLVLALDWLKAQFSDSDGTLRPARNDVGNRVLRKSGQVRLEYAPFPFSEEDAKIVREQTRRLIETARTVSDRVFMIAQPVAYDENELPGVSDRWFSLYPVAGADAYSDNRSVADSIRRETSIVVEVAESMGTPVIDLDAHIRPLLAEREDLFLDKWHFSGPGAAVAAGFVSGYVRDESQGTRIVR